MTDMTSEDPTIEEPSLTDQLVQGLHLAESLSEIIKRAMNRANDFDCRSSELHERLLKMHSDNTHLRVRSELLETDLINARARIQELVLKIAGGEK